MSQLGDRVRQWAEVPGLLRRLELAIGYFLSRPEPPPPPPPRPRHFVSLLVLGRVIDYDDQPAQRRTIVGGACAFVSEGGIALTVRVTRATSDIELLVFCDLARVSVDNMFCGYDVLAMNLGSGAPIAFCKFATPGQDLQAQVHARSEQS